MSTAPPLKRTGLRGVQPSRRANSDVDVAVLVSTYQRPGHLSRCLTSLLCQQGAHGRFEVIVTDDGSQDNTADVVAQFAKKAPFPIRMTTHPHDGFRLAQCRNEGVAATNAPYILFLDGDLLAPQDFVAMHLRRRREGWVLAGDSCFMDEATSQQIDELAIRNQTFWKQQPKSEIRRIAGKAFRAKFYTMIRHSRRPSLKGGNIAMWREDYQRVNGYDEGFVGWGLEETDLQRRLVRQGVRVGSSMGWTRTFHLWHPYDPTFRSRASGTSNEKYLHRRGRLSRCRRGLHVRSLADLNIKVHLPADMQDIPLEIIQLQQQVSRFPHYRQSDKTIACVRNNRVEVEIVVLPGGGKFSGDAECNILIAPTHDPRFHALSKKADLVVSPECPTHVNQEMWFSPDRLADALDAIS